MGCELYLNKAAKTEDGGQNVVTTHSPFSHLDWKKVVETTKKKTCYGYAIMKVCSWSLCSYQAGNLSSETESISQLLF